MKKIFILHGWAYETSKWTPFVQILKKNGFDPILLKIPGLTEKIDRPWNIDDYVEWLDSKLKNEKNVILLGHSNGGKLALSYILKYPNKISKLFLVDSSGVFHKEILLEVKRVVFKFLAKVGVKFTKSPMLRKILYKLTGESDYYLTNDIMKITLQNLLSVDLSSQLEEIDTPTFIIWGKDDVVTPVSDALLFNEGIKNSKLFIINDARHSPQFTNASEVAKIINEHI